MAKRDEYRTPAGSVDEDPGEVHLGNKAALNRTFDGRLDDVRIYNRVLTPVEVAELASGQ